MENKSFVMGEGHHGWREGNIKRHEETFGDRRRAHDLDCGDETVTGHCVCMSNFVKLIELYAKFVYQIIP